MSEESVEIVKRGWEHFKATGESLAEFVAPDFIWDMSTFRDAVGGLDKQYDCAEGAHRFLREWSEPFDEWQIDVERYQEAGDKVVTVCHQRARSKGSGVPVEMRFAFVFTVRSRLITRMEMYADPTEALKAVGLEG
jgi:ketosteroid isomerase-like protein